MARVPARRLARSALERVRSARWRRSASPSEAGLSRLLQARGCFGSLRAGLPSGQDPIHASDRHVGKTLIAKPDRLFTRRALTPSLVTALVLAMLAVTAPAQAKRITPNFFGMHDGQIANGSVPGVPIGSVRLWDTGTSWRQIEVSQGNFHWSTLDRAVTTARSAGLRPLIVLGQTPRFYAKNGKAPGAYGHGATSMPKLRPWKRYVRKVAHRYGKQADYQIWNEPNIINYWTGSPGQMARLTATASKQIKKQAGRKATVVAPAFPLRLKGQQKWYQSYWAQKVGGKSVASYVKVVSVNLYPLADQGPEASMKLLRFAKRVLPRAARGKPIWNTEINYGLLGGDTAKKISDARQAAYVARTLALNAASPVRRVFWYAWALGPIANTHLVENDRTSLTRAGRAWSVARGWIVGTNMKKCSQASSGLMKGVYTCTARKSKREVHRIYWKPSGRRTVIETHRTTRKWTNLADNTTKRRGSLRIKVGKSPIMVTSRR